MKIHFASAFPRQSFCRGLQDFMLRQGPRYLPWQPRQKLRREADL